MPSAIVSCLILLLISLTACRGRPARPTGVDPSATYVETVKGGLWEYCEIKAAAGSTAGEVICSVVNENGKPLFKEAFLPFDGGALPDAGHLAIAQTRYEKAITLSNGRILLPSSEYDSVRKHILWLQGKSPTY